MKKQLLLAALLLAGGTFAQKKITSVTEHRYDEFGAYTDIDSTKYTYADYRGSITSNTPEFGVAPGDIVPIWFYSEPKPGYTSAESFYNTVYPLPLSGDVTSKTYDANYNCLTEGDALDRAVYTYTGSGLVNSETIEYFDGSVWVPVWKITYTYNMANQLTVRNNYDYPAGVETIVTIDSTFYNATSGLFEKGTNWETTDGGVTFYKTQEAFVTNSSGKPSVLDFWMDDDNDPMTPIIWFFRGNYIWAGNNLTSLDVHPVMMGVPQSMVAAQFMYTYDASNRLTNETGSGFGDYQVDYVYDTEGYVTQIDESEMDGSSNWYVANTTKFYYQNTASLVELPTVNVTIFPVPSTDKVTVETTEKITAIQVLSMDGKVMIAQKAGNTVDISTLANGNYLLQVVTNSGTATKTIAKN